MKTRNLVFAGFISTASAMGGLAWAKSCQDNVATAVLAVPDTGALAGSSQDFFANIAGLIAGGVGFGAGIVGLFVTMWLATRY